MLVLTADFDLMEHFLYIAINFLLSLSSFDKIKNKLLSESRPLKVH